MKMLNKTLKKSVSILLTLAMMFGILTVIPIEANAASGVQYIERSWDSSDKKVIETVKTCTDYTNLANRSSDHLEGWYVVSYNMTINSRLYVNASHPVNIILCDGATLTCPKGFEIARRATLSIYGQSGGSGQIVTKPNKEEDSPGNSHALSEVGGRFNVYGGTLDVECGTRLTSLRGAAIGSAINQTPGTISIYGGNVTAKSSDAPAIGNGLEGDSDGSIEIYGGTVTAESNNFSAAIGGADGTDGPAVTISVGTVKATNDHGPSSGAAIGSGRGANRTNPIHITGGTVTALSTDGAAIGAGCEASASNIDLSGGVIVATAFGGGAGIGGGAKGNADSVTISGATVNASSCAYLSSSDFVNAIDKWIGTISYYSPGGNVDVDAIRGQALVALSLYFIQSLSIVLSDGESGCGIGAGYKGTFSNITISNHSDVTANSGKYAAAIGSGDENANGGGTINITNSTITEAKSETDGAGIGGGESGNGGTINITGSTVTAHGGGYDGDGGTITIDNSTVKAYGGTDAAGIGGGEDAGVQKVHVDYTSKAKVCAGGDGNGVAIGPGDYNTTAAWLSGNYPSKGTLTLSPQYHIVEAGSSPGSTSTYTRNAIWNACRNNKYAYIHPCEHGSTYYKADSNYSHYKCCAYCGQQIEEGEYHSFGSDNKCTKCGATTEIISCTFIEKNNSGEVTRTDSMQKYTDWLMPYAENVPDGSLFHYWEYTVSGSTYKLYPGTFTTMNEARTFRAVYAPGVETYYIDENGELQSVTAMRLTKSNLNLDVEWYIIDSESNLSSSDEIQLNRSVKIIIADDADVTIADISNRHNSVSIFGQAKQSGKFTAIGQSYVYDYKQYGANINIKGIKTFNNFVFASGTFVTDLPTTCNNTMELSWYRYDKDSIFIDTIFDCDTFKIADGKAFQNDRGTILQGTLTWSQLRDDVEGKTLTPYTERKYGTPTWTWSKDYSLAVATFKSTDSGVDETITV